MKKLLTTVSFFLLFAVLYFFIDSTLALKTVDGVKTMQVYYELPSDTVDVLFVGSSHVGMSVDTKQLYDEYGIASYSLWSGMQPVWNSYYAVKEALKTQKPRLIVLEGFLCSMDYEYSDETAAFKFIQGMNPSLDKARAAIASFETWQEAMEALWGMPFYHERFDELTQNDFRYSLLDEDLMLQSLDYLPNTAYPITMLDYASITEERALAEKAQTYLDKIINLCKSQNVELILIISPFQASEAEAINLNGVERIAQNMDIPCLNYLKNFDKTGLDAATDFYDIGHMNNLGVKKFTNTLGQYMSEGYSLPDRRKDERHLWYSPVEVADEVTHDYALDQQFTGDGMSRHVDTGMQLYDNRFGTWTLLARLDTKTFDDDQVYFSCFSEVAEAGNYGLLVKKKDNGLLSVRLGGNIETEVAFKGVSLDLAIVKDTQHYSLYADGECIFQGRDLPCNAYGGNLLIGCQELGVEGEKFRYSRTHLHNLEIYQNRALNAQTIAEWSPETLPEMELPLGVNDSEPMQIYTLPEQFMGNNELYKQDTYIDTGVQLLDDPANSFTLQARITTPEVLGSDNVFFSCFSEEEGLYRGLLVRQVSENELNIILGNNYGIQLPITQGSTIDLVITKNVSSYTVYVNGELIVNQLVLTCDAYEGSLLIACQETVTGEVFRQSSVQVEALQVFSGAMNEEAIKALPLPETPQPKERVATSVQYEMPNPFIGDGEADYIDTGVQLFDVPSKDWTLGITLTPKHGKEGSGVFISCFSEDAPNYRGLMMRQDEEGVLNIWVGGAQVLSIALSGGDDPIRLAVVKYADTYNIYQNGALEAEIESSCNAYEGNLLVGCQETAEGELFRHSPVRIESLIVQDIAMGAEEAKAFSLLDAK